MTFVPAKSVMQNQLMRLGPVRERARRTHNTGVQTSVDAGWALLEEFLGLVDVELRDVDVLELGPGRGTAMMAAAIESGVRSYSAFDVEPYLTVSDLPDQRIDHRTDASGTLPWSDESFDVVWSHSVMEHVRDPRATQTRIMRVMRRGGVQIADIDLVDHYQDRKDPTVMFNMLRYSPRMWNLMTSNRSSYTNRLRLSDWRTLLDDVGFEIKACHPCTVDVSPHEMRKLSYLAHLSDEDVVTRGVTFVLIKP